MYDAWGLYLNLSLFIVETKINDSVPAPFRKTTNSV